LIKFRGNFEWKGDWGDESSLWTPALKSEMESKGFSMAHSDDGMFWMSFSDVVKNFIGINVVLAYNPHPARGSPKIWNVARETFWFRFGSVVFSLILELIILIIILIFLAEKQEIMD